MLLAALQSALKNSVLNPELLEVMDYAVFPPGKLFRPRLVEALALDLGQSVSRAHLHLASAIEMHHAYTLVHDDLPAMDNDDERRGKASTHKAYGEWKAILAGDALLIASFHEMAKIDHPEARKIQRLFSWATGAKGLIDGQFRDLKADHEKLPLNEIIRIHELKTARLIQVATLGSALLSGRTSLRHAIDFLRIGNEIGVSFQLLDDLGELSAEIISSHEKNINPFMNYRGEALLKLRNAHERLLNLLSRHKLTHLSEMLQDYFKKNQEHLLKEMNHLEKNMGGDLTELKNWITSFV